MVGDFGAEIPQDIAKGDDAAGEPSAFHVELSDISRPEDRPSKPEAEAVAALTSRMAGVIGEGNFYESNPTKSLTALPTPKVELGKVASVASAKQNSLAPRFRFSYERKEA